MINYLRLFRFPLIFTAIADSAAGYLVVWGMLNPDNPNEPGNPVVLMLLGVASACLYCFGMAMNDIADRERDLKIAPTRVIPSGKISLRGALVAAFLMLVVSLAALLLAPVEFDPLRLCVWGGIVILILAYDFRALKIPPTMGAIRSLNVILGASMVWTGTELDKVQVALILGIPALFYISGVTFVSTLEDKKVQLPILATGGLWMIAGTFTPELIRITLEMPVNPSAWIVSIVLAGWIGWRTIQAKDRAGVMLIVRDGVAGVIVLDAIILISQGLLNQGIGVGGLILVSAVSVIVFKRLG